MIGRASCVEPLGNLIDILANGGKFRSKRFDIGGVGVDDISVNRHLAEVAPIRRVGIWAIFSSMSRFSSSVT